MKVGKAVAELCSSGTKRIWLPGQGECLCAWGLARWHGLPWRVNHGGCWVFRPQSQLPAPPEDQNGTIISSTGGGE